MTSALVALFVALGALGAVLAVLGGRYVLHVVQQRTYRFDEFGSWFAASGNRVASLILFSLLGVCAVLLGSAALGIVAALFGLFVFYNYNFLRTSPAKVPLVYTGRAKRIACTDTALCVLACAAGALLGGLRGLCLALVALPALQVIFVPLAATLNTPYERHLNQPYIDEARQILAKAPNLIVVGITGSYGKTSVKHYLEELLRSRYSVLATPGNFNTTLGVVRTIREHLRPTHEVFLCEMGARRKGDIAEICELVNPSCGIVTSVGPQHLETFGSLEAVAATKFELAQALSGGGKLFVNADSQPAREAAASYPGALLYGTDDACAYRIQDVETGRRGTKFRLFAPDGTSCSFSTKLVGRHNVVNLAGALAVAHSLGVPLESMRVALRRLSPVPHRLSISTSAGTTVIDDAYNSNPVSSKTAIDTLALFEGLKVLVTPGMVELGAQQDRYNAEFAAYAASVCDEVVLVGSHNRKALISGLEQAGFPESRTHWFANVADALYFARTVHAGQERTILIENDLPDSY